MLNKVYEKFKRFIKENYKVLIIFTVLIILFNIKLDYEVYTTGGTINLKDRIKINTDYEEEGSFNLTFVTAIKGTLPVVLLSYIINSWDLVPIENSRIETEDYEEIIMRSKILLKEGVNNSILAALNEAEKEYTLKEESVKVLYVMDEAETEIKVGDKIVSIDKVKIKNTNEFMEQEKNYNDGDSIKIIVERNNKTIETNSKIKTLENQKIIGLILTNMYDIDTNGLIDVEYKSHEGGSSGGLITALYIYNHITEYDLTRNLKIAGTGTIDPYGNVGEIAGIKYKLLGAEKKKMDIYLMPYENYEEAVEIKNKYKLDIDLIKVSSLKEAINKIKNYNVTK